MGIKPLNFPRRYPVIKHGFVDLKTKLDLIQKFSLGHCFWLGACPNRHLQWGAKNWYLAPLAYTGQRWASRLGDEQTHTQGGPSRNGFNYNFQ